MATLQELKQEADSLGISYDKKATIASLTKAIDATKSATAEDSLGQDEQDDEFNPDIVKMAPDVVEDEPVVPKKRNVMAELAAELKRKALAKRVVTITNNDKRDNHMTQTCYLGVDNQYFGVSRIVPLDTPVELEQCLIDNAKSLQIALHVDEVIDGKRTGNRQLRMVKRYGVSYED